MVEKDVLLLGPTQIHLNTVLLHWKKNSGGGRLRPGEKSCFSSISESWYYTSSISKLIYNFATVFNSVKAAISVDYVSRCVFMSGPLIRQRFQSIKHSTDAAAGIKSSWCAKNFRDWGGEALIGVGSTLDIRTNKECGVLCLLITKHWK